MRLKYARLNGGYGVILRQLWLGRHPQAAVVVTRCERGGKSYLRCDLFLANVLFCVAK